MSNLIPIEFKNQRIMTTKVLAEQYGTKEDNISKNFNRNIDRFVEGKHYYKLEGEELKAFKGCGLNDESLKFVSVLYLWTDRGAARHAKILDTDEAWEVYEQLEETYFKAKEQKPACIEDLIIMQAQSLKDLRQQLKQVNTHALEAKAKAEETKEEVQAIRDIMVLNHNSWRKDSSSLINKIALAAGGYEHIKAIREQSYKLLEQRMGVQLSIRLTNKRRRMADEGVCKSKRDKLTILDVITEDKKLIEGYIAIVKDMAIKSGV